MSTSTDSSITKLPNGPKKFIFLANLQAIIDQFGSLDKYSREYGDIFISPNRWDFRR